jgi:hypothetical protein
MTTKRKIRFMWTCSDRVKHEHRYKFTAHICGLIQHLYGLTIQRLGAMTKGWLGACGGHINAGYVDTRVNRLNGLESREGIMETLKCNKCGERKNVEMIALPCHCGGVCKRIDGNIEGIMASTEKDKYVITITGEADLPYLIKYLRDVADELDQRREEGLGIEGTYSREIHSCGDIDKCEMVVR